MLLFVLLAAVHSKPTSEAIVGKTFVCAKITKPNLWLFFKGHKVCFGINTCAIKWTWISNAGSPYLFHEFNFPVDPYRAGKLSPAFQAANGKKGANLVAYFGTGGLRSVERPAVPRPAPQHYHKKWIHWTCNTVVNIFLNKKDDFVIHSNVLFS